MSKQLIKSSKSRITETFFGMLLLVAGIGAGVVLVTQPQLINEHAQVVTYAIPITNNACSPNGKVSSCTDNGAWGQKYCTNGKWTGCVTGGFCTTADNYSLCDCSNVDDPIGSNSDGLCWRFCKPLLKSNSSLNVTNNRNLGTFGFCHENEDPVYRVESYQFVCKDQSDCNLKYPQHVPNVTCDLSAGGLCIYYYNN